MTRAEDIHNRRWAILGVLCLSLFVIVMDNTIVNVALPTLVRELGATTSQLQWIVDAYTLVFAGLLLSAGALGDRFGRKGALTVGMVIFGVVVARGGAVDDRRPADRRAGPDGRRRRADHAGDAVDPDQRVHRARSGRGRSRLGRRSPASAVALGPVTGGFLLEHFSWGSVFIVNVPIVIVAVIAGWLIVPTSRDPRAPRLDVVGALLSIVGLVGARLRDHRGARSRLDLDPRPSSASPRRRRARDLRRRGSCKPTSRCSTCASSRTPASPPRASRSRSSSFALFGFIFMATQYLQFVMGYTPLSAGVHTHPVRARGDGHGAVVGQARRAVRHQARRGARACSCSPSACSSPSTSTVDVRLRHRARRASC